MQTPRPYQCEALAAIEEARERGVRRGLLVLPTGTGKTNVFVWTIQRAREAGDLRPALIVAHREELLQQAAYRIGAIAPGLRVGIERAEDRVPEHGADVVIASVQTIGRSGSKRLNWIEPGLIVIDEAHHALPLSGYGRVVDRFGEDAFVLGVTATPKRLDRMALNAQQGGVFEEVIYTYGIRQAIDDGYLCPLRGYRVLTGVDINHVGSLAGDFNEEQLAEAVVDEERTALAIRQWCDVALGRPTVAFGVNVEHARQIADLFRRVGVRAEAVDGSMGREDRAAAMKRYLDGETTVLSNCMVATEGFDAPATRCILMLRPTKSWSLYAQMVGRGTRILDGKSDCIVIDVVDNSMRHSLATLPAILDLPANLDLEGRTLSETANALEELGTRVAFLQDYAPKTFTELEGVLAEVDLFARLEPPPMVTSGSAMAWLVVPGGYLLACGTPERREARLHEDALGAYHLTLTIQVSNAFTVRRQLVWEGRVGDNLFDALDGADERLLTFWPEARWLAGNDARWRSDPVTPKQQCLLLKWGYSRDIVTRMSKGQASGLITQRLASAAQGRQDK